MLSHNSIHQHFIIIIKNSLNIFEDGDKNPNLSHSYCISIQTHQGERLEDMIKHDREKFLLCKQCKLSYRHIDSQMFYIQIP